jgi:hypothetical protein
MASVAPTVEELQQNAVVQAALEAAWRDSLSDDPDRRHEEGGRIYFELATGTIEIGRAPTGSQRAINLQQPPIRDGFVIVGIFHTHPNPTSEGWEPGPSAKDQRIDQRLGVPDLIRSDEGIFVSGPNSRRGGLIGPPGFPD